MCMGELSSTTAQGEVLSTVQHDQLHQLGGILDFSGTAECACFKRELFKTRWKGLHEVLVRCHDSPVVFFGVFANLS